MLAFLPTVSAAAASSKPKDQGFIEINTVNTKIPDVLQQARLEDVFYQSDTDEEFEIVATEYAHSLSLPHTSDNKMLPTSGIISRGKFPIRSHIS